MICRLCQSLQTRPVQSHKSQFVDLEYTLFECDDCRSAFFDLQQHKVNLEQLYTDEAATKAGIYETAFRPSRYWQHEMSVILHLAAIPIEAVLDVGCRTGDFLLHWPQDVQRIGVEISARSAAVARSRGLVIYQDSLEEVRFGRSFDAVTCYAVIEHLPDPITFLSRLSELVNPGGVLAILVPTRECLKHKVLDGFGRRWHMYSPPQHLSFVSRALLDQTLTKSGFVLKRRRFTSGGMFNPLGKLPFAGRIGAKLMESSDRHSPTNLFPLFDHMYSYFQAGRRV